MALLETDTVRSTRLDTREGSVRRTRTINRHSPGTQILDLSRCCRVSTISVGPPTVQQYEPMWRMPGYCGRRLLTPGSRAVLLQRWPGALYAECSNMQPNHPEAQEVIGVGRERHKSSTLGWTLVVLLAGEKKRSYSQHGRQEKNDHLYRRGRGANLTEGGYFGEVFSFSMKFTPRTNARFPEHLMKFKAVQLGLMCRIMAR